MKFLFLIATASLLFCCNDRRSNEKNAEIPVTYDLASITDNFDILGEWAFCSESSGKQIIQKNVCWTVSFIGNGLGSVNKGNGLPENFEWRLKNNSLTFYYTDSNRSNTFTDTAYHVIVTKEEERYRMEIEQLPPGSGVYYLSK